MIKSFKCKETKNIFSRNFSKQFPENIQKVAYRKLVMLDNAYIINDLRMPPGNRLEKLSGDRKEQYSIRINNQWRICFKWKNSEAFEVEITDYH